MQGTIAQIVALVVHGNAFLASSEQSEAFPSSHSTTAFCEFVRFVDLKRTGGAWSERPFASDPAAWLKELHGNGARAMRMHHISIGENALAGVTDRMLVGFVSGGGRWLMETSDSGGSDFWEGRWKVGDRSRADRKIWQVTYGRIAADQPITPQAPADIESLKLKLSKNLTRISAFARRHKQDGFAKAFETGLANLESSTPGAGAYHQDFATDNMPLASAQLLAAAQSSWVFGGMGSWNDMFFEGDEQKEYEALSEDLYKLLNASIVAAVNSTASFDAIARGSEPSRKLADQPTKRRPWWRLWT